MLEDFGGDIVLDKLGARGLMMLSFFALMIVSKSVFSVIKLIAMT